MIAGRQIRGPRTAIGRSSVRRCGADDSRDDGNAERKRNTKHGRDNRRWDESWDGRKLPDGPLNDQQFPDCSTAESAGLIVVAGAAPTTVDALSSLVIRPPRIVDLFLAFLPLSLTKGSEDVVGFQRQA